MYLDSKLLFIQLKERVARARDALRSGFSRSQRADEERKRRLEVIRNTALGRLYERTYTATFYGRLKAEDLKAEDEAEGLLYNKPA